MDPVVYSLLCSAGDRRNKRSPGWSRRRSIHKKSFNEALASPQPRNPRTHTVCTRISLSQPSSKSSKIDTLATKVPHKSRLRAPNRSRETPSRTVRSWRSQCHAVNESFKPFANTVIFFPTPGSLTSNILAYASMHSRSSSCSATGPVRVASCPSSTLRRNNLYGTDVASLDAISIGSLAPFAAASFTSPENSRRSAHTLSKRGSGRACRLIAGLSSSKRVADRPQAICGDQEMSSLRAKRRSWPKPMAKPMSMLENTQRLGTGCVVGDKVSHLLALCSIMLSEPKL